MRAVGVVMVVVAALMVAGCGGTSSSSESTSASTSVGAEQESTGEQASAPYVNLGDSYAAGTGLRPLAEDSEFQCQQSGRNFARLVAQQRRIALTDVSCAAASTSDFFTSQYFGVGPQLDALGPRTEIATMMIGGNNGDVFSDTLRLCGEAAATDPTGSPCRERYGSRFDDAVRNTTYPALVSALRAARQRAPKAHMVIAGYPWIVPPTEGCYPRMRVAAGDVPYVRELQATLNDAVHRAADANGITFVDMSVEGHDACRPVGQRWIEPQEGSSAPITVHPNAAGQQAIADRVEAALDR